MSLSTLKKYSIVIVIKIQPEPPHWWKQRPCQKGGDCFSQIPQFPRQPVLQGLFLFYQNSSQNLPPGLQNEDLNLGTKFTLIVFPWWFTSLSSSTCRLSLIAVYRLCFSSHYSPCRYGVGLLRRVWRGWRWAKCRPFSSNLFVVGHYLHWANKKIDLEGFDDKGILLLTKLRENIENSPYKHCGQHKHYSKIDWHLKNQKII